MGETCTERLKARSSQESSAGALNETRRQLAATGDRLATAEKQGAQQQTEIQVLTEQVAGLNASGDRLGRELAETAAASAARLERGDRLDREIKQMKASRSWRWTGWLRSIERRLRGGKS